MKQKFIIRLIATLYRLFGKKRKGNSHFLIVSTTGLGDTLWSLPAVRSLRKSFPKAKISILTGPFGKELFKGSGVDHLIEVPKERGLKRLRQFPHLLKQLKMLRAETALFFHVQPTYALLVLLSGATTYGNPAKVPASTCRHLFPFAREHEHLISHRLRMIEAVGGKTFYKSLHLETDPALTQKMRGDRLRIGLCIGSQDEYKIWSPEQFAKLGHQLREELDAEVVLIGSKGENHLANRVRAYFPEAMDLTGKFSLHELIHFIDGLDLVISNDTGPAHIAYAVSTPCITLFSPTNAEQNGPYHAAAPAIVITIPTTCTPCIEKECKVPLCMRQISTRRVFNEAKELLAEINSSSKSAKLLQSN